MLTDKFPLHNIIGDELLFNLGAKFQRLFVISHAKAKKMKCYKRPIYKQFVSVCGPQFLSYRPKSFTHLRRALYGDAILVYQYGRQKSTETSGVHSSKKALSFYSRTSIGAHKHIF